MPECRRPARARRGIIAIVILAMLMVILGFAMLLKVMSGGAYREVDVLVGHMRAISVAESQYGEIVARLSATSWTNRWFKGTPDAKTGVAIAGGTADYMIQDAAQVTQTDGSLMAGALASTNQADLLIKGYYDKSTIVMYWRLSCPDDSIDALARVVPSIAMFPPDNTPVQASLPGPFQQMIQTAIAQREQNRKLSDPMVAPLRDAQTPGEVLSLLGATLSKPVVENTFVNPAVGPVPGVPPPRVTVPLATPPAAVQAPAPVVPPVSPAAGGPGNPTGAPAPGPAPAGPPGPPAAPPGPPSLASAGGGGDLTKVLAAIATYFAQKRAATAAGTTSYWNPSAPGAGYTGFTPGGPPGQGGPLGFPGFPGPGGGPGSPGFPGPGGGPGQQGGGGLPIGGGPGGEF